MTDLWWHYGLLHLNWCAFWFDWSNGNCECSQTKLGGKEDMSYIFWRICFQLVHWCFHQKVNKTFINDCCVNRCLPSGIEVQSTRISWWQMNYLCLISDKWTLVLTDLLYVGKNIDFLLINIILKVFPVLWEYKSIITYS